MARQKPEIVAAMELLLTSRQIERIMSRTRFGDDRVKVLRSALNRGLDQMEGVQHGVSDGKVTASEMVRSV